MPLAARHGAVVRPLDRVLLDEGPAVAQRAAPPQAAVERLQPLRRLPDEQHERDVAEVRADVHPDLRLVGHPGRRVDLVLRHPAFEQRADRRLGPGDLQLVGFREEAGPNLLGLAVRRLLRAVSGALDVDALAQHDPLTGRGILTG